MIQIYKNKSTITGKNTKNNEISRKPKNFKISNVTIETMDIGARKKSIPSSNSAIILLI